MVWIVDIQTMTNLTSTQKTTISVLLLVRHGGDIPQHNFTREIQTDFLPRVGERMSYLRASKTALPIEEIRWELDGTPTVILQPIVVQPQLRSYVSTEREFSIPNQRMEEVVSFIQDSGWKLDRTVDGVYNKD